MYCEVNNQRCFIDTGRASFNPDLPCILFLHGSGLDHNFWTPIANWFTSHGFSVLVPDLPGHSLTEGDALPSIEQSAVWLDLLLNEMDIERVHVVGHSQGFLSAIEIASLAPDKVISITGIATSSSIPVNPALIDTARKSAREAAELMLKWGFANNPQIKNGPSIGLSPIAMAREIMSRNPLAVDLQACNDYQRGTQIAETIQLPCLLILSEDDKMTRLSEGKKLATALSAQTVILQGHGHMLPIEAPDACIQHLNSFLTLLGQERKNHGN